MKQLLMKKRISGWAAALLSFLLLLSVCSAAALAYERIDTNAGTSLTAYFTENGSGIQGTSFRLYRVADVSDAVEFELTGEFSGAPVSLENVESASTWSELALTLSAYADANGISPIQTAETDADGSVTFSGLSVGLYLLAGDTAVMDDYMYTPTASMILLPTLQADDTWNYNPSVEVKYTRTYAQQTQDVTVKKVWNDGNNDQRPDSVTIQLLQDGTVQDTVTLNAANNWTHTWNNRPSTYEENGEQRTHIYTVNETNVASGYTVTISQRDTVYTVTNKKTPAQTPGTPDENLPQTGTLNWPIPVMTIVGLLLVIGGWYLISGKKGN